jgi:ElaB/YqjD/DUF883 family membrane-anchored ribosome-binding protein
MAEKVHRTADVPNVDVYPGELQQERASRHEGNAPLESGARMLGTAIGKLVATLREGRDVAREMAAEARAESARNTEVLKNQARQTGIRITEKAADLTDRVTQKSMEWSAAGTAAAEQILQAPRDKARAVANRITAGYYRTRSQVTRFAREHPAPVLVAAGGVGFLLGLGLRLRRSNHES